MCFLPRPLPPPLPRDPIHPSLRPLGLEATSQKGAKAARTASSSLVALGGGAFACGCAKVQKLFDVLTTLTASAVMRSPSNSRMRPAHCGHPDGCARPWKAPGLHFIQASGLQGRAWMVCERATVISNQPNTRIMSANLDVLMALTATTMMRSLANSRSMRPRPTCKHATRKGHLAAAGCLGLAGQTTCNACHPEGPPGWLLATLGCLGFLSGCLLKRAKSEREGWIGWWTRRGRGGQKVRVWQPS